MFGFRVIYLRGSVTAADVRTGNDKDRVEWPPHPDRLFCALVQAWGDLGATDAARSALLWLEALPAPWIRCGEIFARDVIQQFVPVNDEESWIGRKRQPRRIPTAALSQDEVVFWWPDVTPTPDNRTNLVGLSSAVGSL